MQQLPKNLFGFEKKKMNKSWYITRFKNKLFKDFFFLIKEKTMKITYFKL